MASGTDNDLAVDVLVIGGGLLGHYVAKQLASQYAVCLLHDPSMPSEALDAEGYLAAGYTGNDVGRIQPARRAANYWRLWSESNDVPRLAEPALTVVADEDISATTRLWSDASLPFAPAALPSIFADGVLGADPDGAEPAPYSTFATTDDVVMDPADVIAELRAGLEDCWLEGEVTKLALAGDVSVGYVEVDVAGEPFAIVPRYTVLAASAANAPLLFRLAVRFHDTQKRKAAVEAVKGSQAVRKQTVVCVRGDLPLVAGHFGGLRITSHAATASTDVIWLVNPPIDDTVTTLGQEELRFAPPVDAEVVASTVERLFALAPAVDAAAESLSWSAYVRRKTEHPMMATPDTEDIAQPSPAKIETLGLEALLALWPSHLSYTMVVGDVAAERVREALGPAGVFEEGLELEDLPLPDFDPRARWDRDDFPWHDWSAFARAYDLKRD